MLESFHEIVEQEKDQVYSFAFYYLGNREEAEDVTQEVLVKLWQSWRELDLESAPRWLNRVTRNACFDLLRRRRVRRGLLVENDGDETAQAAVSPAPDPEAAATQTDFQRRLQRLLAQLPEPFRSVLILREVQDYKYGEISQALDLPLNTVKTYLHRGRRLLRERLREVHGNEAERRACLS